MSNYLVMDLAKFNAIEYSWRWHLIALMDFVVLVGVDDTFTVVKSRDPDIFVDTKIPIGEFQGLMNHIRDYGEKNETEL